MIDYPHVTTRAALDLIFSGTVGKFQDCKIILAHAGGTPPYLISRVANLSITPGFGPENMEADEIVSVMGKFWYDLALSSEPRVARLLIDLVGVEKLLYGSDFPYAGEARIEKFMVGLEACELNEKERERVYWRNAHDLFPRLGNEGPPL
jgi:predicted TIM-barrel fold metal-dependent hydrolase